MNQCLIIVDWALENKFQLNFNLNSHIFIQENVLEKCRLESGGHFASISMEGKLYFVDNEFMR